MENLGEINHLSNLALGLTLLLLPTTLLVALRGYPI